MTEPLATPRGWKKTKLGAIAQFRNGINFTKSGTGQPVRIVGVADFWERSVIGPSDVTTTVQPNGLLAADDLLRNGDLLLVRSNGNKALIGRCVIVYPGDVQTTFSGFTIRARLISDQITNTKYIAQLLQSSLFKKQLNLEGSGTNISNLNQQMLGRLEIFLPPPQEQQQITDILTTWDQAVSAIDREIGQKDRIIDRIRDISLAGVSRTDRGNEPWPVTRLGEVTKQLTGRNAHRYGRERVMGVLKTDGLLPMKEHVIAADLARYLIVPPFAFAYNPMRINIGSIVMSELADEVIVSPDYVVFACRPDRCSPCFLNHLRKSRRWQDFMAIAGSGGVRVRIYYPDLADFEFPLPPLQTQERIVKILDDAHREITALKAERRALRAQRDALASELLTGRVRVPDAAPAAFSAY